MTATHADQIIDGYLKRLDSELSSFPSSRRKELTGQIAEHIAQARQELPEETDADLLTILDRLGEPDEIAAEARANLNITTSKAGPLEILALLLIGVAQVIFPILPVGWALGTGLVWRSKAWTPREKYYGAYLPLVVGLALLLISALASGFFGRLVEVAGVGFVIANLLMPLGTAIFLGARLGRRLPVLAWAAIAIVAISVYLPAVAAFIPAQASAFIGTPFGESAQAPVAGQPQCAGFYGSLRYAGGLPVAATAPVSLGICWDGNKVTKSWGPDCYPTYGPVLRVEVQSCTVQTEPDGSMIISIQSSATAMTAPFFTQSGGTGWLITPDGRFRQL
jgi:HAAS